MVKAALERHLEMIYKHHTDGCLPCQNGAEMNPQTPWRQKETGGPPPGPAEPPPGTAPPPGMPPVPPVPPGDIQETEYYEMDGMLSGFVYRHSPLPSTQFFNHNAYAEDSKRDEDDIPDLLITPSAAWQCH